MYLIINKYLINPQPGWHSKKKDATASLSYLLYNQTLFAFKFFHSLIVLCFILRLNSPESEIKFFKISK